MNVKDIRITWDDGTVTLLMRDSDRYWTRIVQGTKDSPCFATSRMDIDDMRSQLKALMESVEESP